jgi:S-adenosylmethionine decarboxylase
MNAAIAAAGRHLLADFYGVNAAALRDLHALESLLRTAASTAGAQVLGTHFHSFGDKEGVTGVVLLAESHISIHTWPESGFAAADIFMCGSADPESALHCLLQALAPNRHRVERVGRGPP